MGDANTPDMGDPDDTPDSPRRLVVIVSAAGVAAVLTGFVGGAFRWCLARAGELTAEIADWAHRWSAIGWLAPLLVAAAGAAIGRALIRLTPRASGSGIQDVEAVWRDERFLTSWDVVPVTFAGGLTAIGSGMVLGREGPTVHMGSVAGSEVGRWFRLGDHDRRLLHVALGGAGLAVAFNAPIGGALFALEEVTKSFKLRMVLITLFSTSIAVACSRLILGDQPDFAVPDIAPPAIGSLVTFVIFGLISGLLGVGYNMLIMQTLRANDRLSTIPPEGRAAAVGALVGLLLYLDPLTVGGGDAITQLLLSSHSFVFWSLVGYLAVRFVIGPLCYSVGVPGGLFAPLLAVGALWGSVFHAVVHAFIPAIGDSALPFVLVGMTAFFAGVVRAPVTGIALIIEMTATTTLTVPMLAACAAATLSAWLVKDLPIYDQLRSRMLSQVPSTKRPDPTTDG